MPRSALFYKNQPGGFSTVEDLGRSTGNRYYVDSGASDNGTTSSYGLTPDAPFSTIAAAITQATANNGDIIYIMPGHAETLTAAVAFSKAGLTFIGLGEGNDRPAITVGGTIDGWNITANDVKIKNVRFVTPTAAATSNINVGAARCVLDELDMDLGANAVDPITVTAAGEVCTVRNSTFTVSADGPDSCVTIEGVVDRFVFEGNTVVGSDGTNALDQGVVDFTSQACTNPIIRNNHVSGGGQTVALTANAGSVVASVIGPNFYGGSATNEDNATEQASVGSINDTTTDSVHGKIGTDTEMADNSLYDLLGADAKTDAISAALYGAAGISTYPAAAAPANAVSIAEVLRAVYDRQLGDGTDASTNSRLGKRVTFGAADVLDSVQNALFTVSGGRVLLTQLSAEVSGAAVDAGASNTNFIMNPTVGTDANLCAVLDIDGDELGTIYSITGTITDAMTGGSGGGAMAMGRPIIIPEGTVDIKSAADSGTGGALLSAELWYIPLDDGASVA